MSNSTPSAWGCACLVCTMVFVPAVEPKVCEHADVYDCRQWAEDVTTTDFTGQLSTASSGFGMESP